MVVMLLVIICLSLCLYFYRQEVELGVRDGMWGEWYYAQLSDSTMMVSRDFGSFDYPIYAEDIRQLEERLKEAFPRHRILLPNPADLGYVSPFILRSVDTPKLTLEEQSRVNDIILAWQEDLIRSRSPRE